MSNRTFYPSQSYGIGHVYLGFRFQCNGASSPLAANFEGAAGAVSSIVHSGGGQTFVVTLADTFNRVIFGSADFITTASAGAYCTVGSYTGEGTSTPLGFTISTWTAAGAAFNDAPSTSTICFSLELRNTSTGSYLK